MCDPRSDNDTGTANTDCPAAGSRCGYTSAYPRRPYIGRLFVSANNARCCTASPDNYDGFNYCTRMPTGTACWSNPMCASNSCQGVVMQQGLAVAPGACA